jgi:hypothetical protein
MSAVNKDLVPALNETFRITLPDNVPLEELTRKLAAHINQLINHDFEKLVALLYRVDVSEKKLRDLLHHHDGENAASLIASLIIERQLQKIKTRQQYRSRDDDIDENERW